MKKLFIVIGFCWLAAIGFSQSNNDILANLKTKNGSGKVEVIQDERIECLYHRYNKKRKDTPIKGYRVKIFSYSGTHAEYKATKCQHVFDAKFPNRDYHVMSYVIWDVPNFKVYVGDFRTKTEALRFQKIISKEFPNGFYVFCDINLPEL